MVDIQSFVPSFLVQVFAGLGVLYFASKAVSFLNLLATSFLLPGTSISKFGPKGSWALITGASDGIGKEFALQLAKKGLNLILVSRTKSKLEQLENDIRAINADAKTKIHAMDFAQNKDSDYASLEKLITSLDISVLINNVGQSHSIPVPFLETEQSEINNIININCFGTLRTTQLVTPGMVQRKRGLILTMGSFGGVFPTPFLATYSGSKAFLQAWGTALGSELAQHGITVEVVQSHLVTSAMSKIRRSSLLIPTPRAFVRATLSKIGLSGGSQGIAYTSTPYWSHGLYQWILSNVVGTTSHFTVNQNRIMHETIRKRALRKAARQAESDKKGQ